MSVPKMKVYQLLQEQNTTEMARIYSLWNCSTTTYGVANSATAASTEGTVMEREIETSGLLRSKSVTTNALAQNAAASVNDVGITVPGSQRAEVHSSFRLHH